MNDKIYIFISNILSCVWAVTINVVFGLVTVFTGLLYTCSYNSL
jgi:hypothetical protein